MIKIYRAISKVTKFSDDICELIAEYIRNELEMWFVFEISAEQPNKCISITMHSDRDKALNHIWGEMEDHAIVYDDEVEALVIREENRKEIERQRLGIE